MRKRKKIPDVGIEPTTTRLKAERSTTELTGHVHIYDMLFIQFNPTSMSPQNCPYEKIWHDRDLRGRAHYLFNSAKCKFLN